MIFSRIENIKNALETPKNDSGVSSEDKSSEEWQDLQKLYGQKPDPNGNSNNNSVSIWLIIQTPFA